MPEERWLKVSRETYDAVNEGDTVRVATHTGPLGIAYTEAIPCAENGK